MVGVSITVLVHRCDGLSSSEPEEHGAQRARGGAPLTRTEHRQVLHVLSLVLESFYPVCVFAVAYKEEKHRQALQLGQSHNVSGVQGSRPLVQRGPTG